jgi:hypothetical protein
MTNQYAIADPVAWEQAMADLRTADAIKKEFEDTDDLDKYEEVAVRFDIAKDKVLELHAPDFKAIIAKLHLLFAEEVASDLSIYDAHRLVIGDLHRLTQSWGPPSQPDE